MPHTADSHCGQYFIYTECKAAFDIFDRDGDGHITPLEVATIIDHLGMSWDQKRLREMIQEVDKDGNGTIEFDEFLLMMQMENTRKENQAELLAAFQVFDKKGRGYITASTFRAILTKGGVTPFEGDVEHIIRQADTKGNGRIYYEAIVKTITFAGALTL